MAEMFQMDYIWECSLLNYHVYKVEGSEKNDGKNELKLLFDKAWVSTYQIHSCSYLWNKPDTQSILQG